MTEKHLELVAHISVGMNLCTSDFTRWGIVGSVAGGEAGKATVVVGHVEATGQIVYVPTDAILEIHGDCVRLNAPSATVDAQGWERRPPELS